MSVNSIESISEQYFLLKMRYSELRSECEGQAQVDQLDTQYRLSRRNFYSAINTIFDENKDKVKELRKELEDNTAEIKKSLENHEKIDKVLGLITDGVDLATSLIQANNSAS